MAGRSHSGKPLQKAPERHWESEYLRRTWVTTVILLVIAIFLYRQKGPSNPGTQFPVKPEGDSDPGTQLPVKPEGESDPGTQLPVIAEGESDPGTQLPLIAEGDSDRTQCQIISVGYWENQYVTRILIAIVIILAIFLYRRLKHRNLRFRVVCYGQGDVHKDILMDSSMSEDDRDIPYVLYVYKVSRELEDLRTALRCVEKKQMLKRKDICAVILLDKVMNAQNKTIDIDHQGIFDGKTVVVRICWEEKWFLFPRKVQKGPGYWKAMEKVIQSIREW